MPLADVFFWVQWTCPAEGLGTLKGIPVVFTPLVLSRE